VLLTLEYIASYLNVPRKFVLQLGRQGRLRIFPLLNDERKRPVWRVTPESFADYLKTCNLPADPALVSLSQRERERQAEAAIARLELRRQRAKLAEKAREAR
jgi:hypothetical protein